MDETFLVKSPEALKAIAHPVRQEILLQLAVLGHARAADLARAIDEPANSVSFHLRTLAKAGMVTEAPEHARDKRDRVWRNVAESYRVDPDTPGAAGQALQPALAWLQDLVRDVGAADDDGERPGRIIVNGLPLTADEAKEFGAELESLQERWADRVRAAARAEPGTEREMYQVFVALAPRRDHPAPR